VNHDFDPAVVTDLDVRELLARGEEPHATILTRADALGAGEVLHVRSPFQPTPLYQVMTERGFAWRNARFADDDWSSWFWHADQPPPPARAMAATTATPEGVTDLRPLAPPEPLLWILRWTAEAPDGALLRVMLPFFPTPLPDLLAGSGWTVETEEEREDGVVVRIRKR
jgi:uncharacterized protein (DUF2249 family)